MEYISAYGPQNAEKVPIDLLSKISTLTDHPQMYSPDKFQENNDGNYRAFELHNYHIAYHFPPGQIRILRIRHTAMEPKRY